MIKIRFPKKLVHGEKVVILDCKLPCGRKAENEHNFYELKKCYDKITGKELSDEEFVNILKFTVGGLVHALDKTVFNACNICGLCE